MIVPLDPCGLSRPNQVQLVALCYGTWYAGEGTNGRRPKPTDAERRSGESCTTGRKLPQPSQMFDDVDAVGKKAGVGRTFAVRLVRDVVNVDRVNADEKGTVIGKVVRRLSAEEGSTFGVSRRTEVSIPARVQEHRFPGDLPAINYADRNGTPLHFGEMEHFSGQVDQRSQVETGQIGSIRVAVVWTVKIRARITEE